MFKKYQKHLADFYIIVYDFDRKYQKHVPLWLEDSIHLFIRFMILSRHDICRKINFS